MPECYVQAHYIRNVRLMSYLLAQKKTIEQMRVRPLLLGDGAYPSTTWLVKPYPGKIRLTHT